MIGGRLANLAVVYGDAAAWFANCRNVLLVTHARPDGDAFGSLAGLSLLLLDRGLPHYAYMGVPTGRRYARLLPEQAINCQPPPDLAVFDALCCLDCATADRLDLPVGLASPAAISKVLVVDHHPDNPRYGSRNLVVPAATSTTEVLLGIAEAGGWHISPAAATALMVGLITDCGAFRFNNTSERAFETAASLMRYGTDYRAIIDALYFRQPPGLLRLQAELLEQAQFEMDGQLAWSVLTPEMVGRHRVEPQETENLIDVLRCIDGVEIACVLQPEADQMRFSLRSRSAGISAGRIAKALGGGGHAAAAGARVAGLDLDQATAQLRHLAQQELAGKLVPRGG